MRRTEATREITAEMLKIRAFISRKVDVIKAGSKEKSPSHKSQISGKGVLKLNVSFWIRLQGTSACHSLQVGAGLAHQDLRSSNDSRVGSAVGQI